MKNENDWDSSKKIPSVENNRIHITTLQALELQGLEHARSLSYNQRMENLQILISIIHSEEERMAMAETILTSLIRINQNK